MSGSRVPSTVSDSHWVIYLFLDTPVQNSSRTLALRTKSRYYFLLPVRSFPPKGYSYYSKIDHFIVSILSSHDTPRIMLKGFQQIPEPQNSKSKEVMNLALYPCSYRLRGKTEKKTNPNCVCLTQFPQYD